MDNKVLIEKLKEEIAELKKQLHVKWFAPGSYLRKLEHDIASLESQQEKTIPTDEDIENASLDYLQSVPYLDWNDQKAKSAYQQGAKDARDGNIYVSPKVNN